MQRTVTPQDYIDRLNELAAGTNHIDRFYLFLEDDLYEMESELADSEQSREFYDLLLGQFRKWRDEMGEDAWSEVEQHNDSLNGANRNWLLDEL